jgi:hypothetical protein
VAFFEEDGLGFHFPCFPSGEDKYIISIWDYCHLV